MIFLNNINGMFILLYLCWGPNVWENQIRGILIIIQANILWSTVSIFEKAGCSSASFCLMRGSFCI